MNDNKDLSALAASQDKGGQPYVTNLLQAVIRNDNFRTALWTGKHMQLTAMMIPEDSEIGLEQHKDLDQFLYIESGYGYVTMGDSKEHLEIQHMVSPGYCIFVPAGTWHNLINTSRFSLRLFSIYAPPQHSFGTVHPTKKDADEAENH